MDQIKSRSFEQNGAQVKVTRVIDPTPDIGYLTDESRYRGIEESDAALYREQDAVRVAAFNAGEWQMIGIVVTIRVQTASNWADGGHVVGRDSLWGIESDSEESYLASVEAGCISEAWEEVTRTKQALDALVIP